jgi:putative spermidine/putrescine transport system permease protein
MPALLAAPAAAIVAAFFLFPLTRLVVVGAGGKGGLAAYLLIFTNARYAGSLISTIVLSLSVTVAAVSLSTIAGFFLARASFPGRAFLISTLTLPLAFPGVVVGFLVIMLGGRLGIVGDITQILFGQRVVFAYSITGLFVGYLYFSIPRAILTIMAAVETLDRSREEAARSLGAGHIAVARDVILPGLAPALVATSAICFATAMGAFGTAFTLATNLNVLPMTIYTEFTLYADVAVSAALSVVLGAVTWIALALARTVAGSTVAAAG